MPEGVRTLALTDSPALTTTVAGILLRPVVSTDRGDLATRILSTVIDSEAHAVVVFTN